MGIARTMQCMLVGMLGRPFKTKVTSRAICRSKGIDDLRLQNILLLQRDGSIGALQSIQSAFPISSSPNHILCRPSTPYLSVQMCVKYIGGSVRLATLQMPQVGQRRCYHSTHSLYSEDQVTTYTKGQGSSSETKQTNSPSVAQEVDEVTKEKESEVEKQNSQNKPLVQEPPQPQMPKIEEQNGTTEIKSGTVNIEQEGSLEQKKTKKHMAPNHEIGVRCYSIIPDVDLRKVVEQALPTEIQPMWKERCQSGHLASTMHIQLVHYRMQLHHRGAEVWKWCWSFLTKRDPVWFHFRLTHLVWDDRIVLAVVDGLEFDASEARNAGVKAEDGNVFVDGLPDWICSSLHIILVKNNEQVSHGEARALVRQWKEAPQSVNSIPLDDVQGKGDLRKFFGRILKLNYLRELMAQRREEKQEREQEVANR